VGGNEQEDEQRMNWIKRNIDNIELFLFSWAGVWNIIHGLSDANGLQIQLGFLWLCVGFIDYKGR
jgi:hypothetical protein